MAGVTTATTDVARVSLIDPRDGVVFRTFTVQPCNETDRKARLKAAGCASRSGAGWLERDQPDGHWIERLEWEAI